MGRHVSARLAGNVTDDGFRRAENRALLAIAAVISDGDQAVIVKAYSHQNRALAGAGFTDVLSMAFARDHGLGWTGPFDEIHQAELSKLRSELGVIDDLYGPGFLVGLATMVHALLAQDLPAFEDVAGTAKAAVAYWPEP